MMTSAQAGAAQAPAAGRLGKASGECSSRRNHLLAVLRNHDGGPVTTKLALAIYAQSSAWATVGRNTARRDLRDLARRTYLVPAEHHGARSYTLGSDPNPAHPARGVRKLVLAAIQAEGGEWTTGRVKRTWRQFTGTHVLRMSVRRFLAGLHRDGYLERHDDTPHRFYTVRKDHS
ncbi:hypothetical protein ACFVZH_22660 [Streptomyces sp. NPDC059534]|uniref:hypothetical protein n=1 Tax=Streptomyces sp. NPDC059534 TaxID=3346859 RepID=UPI0036B5E7C8